MRRLIDSLRCCLNPKVIGVLTAAGLMLRLVAPASGAAALPLLFALVCPLSMGVMAWQMHRGGDRRAADARSAPDPAATQDVDALLRGLREEVDIARARGQLTDRGDRR